MLFHPTSAFFLALPLFTQALPARGSTQDARLLEQLNQDPAGDDNAGVDAGDNQDYLALLTDCPHNGQFDSNACPDYATCSANGDDYLSELQLTFLDPNNVDRNDGGPIFRRDYKAELFPLTQQGASISADLSAKGINLLDMLLISTSSRTNPNPWLEYFNIFDTNNGVIIGISNWWSHDYMHTLSWSELVYQTWKETSEQQSKGAATLFAGIWQPGGPISNLKYIIHPQLSELGTLAVLTTMYEKAKDTELQNSVPGTVWRYWWALGGTVNWFVALLGTDAIKGTVWLLNDHAIEIGGKEIIEIRTRWTGKYTVIWYVF